LTSILALLRNPLRLALAPALLLFLSCTRLQAVETARVKELVNLEGVRENQLLGYGLVVGLNGTGDKRQTFFSTQSLANLLDRMGVQVNANAMLVRNMAAVMVTANLPAFSQPGTRIDVTVAAIGDAQNLQGGILIQTPLRAANGQVFAVAQGAVVTGGFVAGGRGNQQTVNHPTVGRVPGGALVEREAPSVVPTQTLRLQLRRSDFSSAVRIAKEINSKFAAEGDAPPLAVAKSSALIEVATPAAYKGREVELYAEIENLRVPIDNTPRVVVNERTGTITMGKDVTLSPVSVMHGSLSIEITTSFIVSQPEPLSGGKTTVVPQVGVGVKEEAAKALTLKAGTTVDEFVKALRQIGSTARDVIAVLQTLKAAGALQAELEVL
jgi:flagellar P-ring protein FlgI